MSHQNRFPDTHTSQQPPRNPTPQFPPSQGGYHWSCNLCNSVFWTREQLEQHQFHCPEKTDTQTQLPYPQLAVRAHTPHKYSGAYDGMSQQSFPPPRGIYPYSTALYSQRPLQHDPTHSTAAHFQHPVPDPIPRYPPPSQIQYPTPRASPGTDLQYSTSYLPAMAVSSVSQPRDNLLEALRMLVEERKKEVREVFLELRTELEQCEERVNKELCELYSDTRERVERDEKKIGKLETAKSNLQTDLVDNEFNSILQTTMDNFDAQIAEIRRSSITIPRDVELEWNKEELKKSIERVCRIVSSSCDARQTVQASGVISHPYEEKRVLSEQPRQIGDGAGSWKCPLCDKRLHSEGDKDIHMATDCKFQDPVEDKVKRRQSAVNLTRPSKDKLHQASSFVTSYSLISKTPVMMKWFLRAGEQIKEREIYFFSKNGEMFTFTSEDTKGLGNACFKCDCVMEVGEHGGSLNVGNLGVFKVTPFKVERRDPSYQVTIKLAGRDDELHNGTKPTILSSGNSRSQLSGGKGVSNEKNREVDQQQELLEKRDRVSELMNMINLQERQFRSREEEWKREFEEQKAAIKHYSDQLSKSEKICESLRRERDALKQESEGATQKFN